MLVDLLITHHHLHVTFEFIPARCPRWQSFIRSLFAEGDYNAMKNKLTRREFLEKTTLTVAAGASLTAAGAPTQAAQKKQMPMRKLGRTGGG